MELRSYQQDCLEIIETKAKEGISRQMVALPTGSGKTVIFSELIRRKNLKTLVIAHRIELIEQAKDKLLAIAPDLNIGVLCGQEKDFRKQVTIASIQSSSNVLDFLRAQNYQLLIIDEAHHAAAKTYQRLVEHLGFKPSSCKPNKPVVIDHSKLLVGFTATPKRGDKIGLDHIFQEVVFSMSIKKLVHRGFLVKPEGLHIKVGIDLKNVRTEMGDFKKASLRKIMLSDKARDIVVETIKRFAADRRGIVFSVDIGHAEMLKQDILDAGFSCDVVHSKVPLNDRKQRLEGFASGKLQFIVNPMILTEGFDCPRADCMINAAPTKNRSLYIQKAGRVLRIHPEKGSALLIDFGVTKRKHKLVTAIDLMGEEITMRTVTDYEELYPPPPPSKEDLSNLALEASNEEYDPLDGRRKKITPISSHDSWATWPSESVPATEKQKDLIAKLSKSTKIGIPFIDTLGIRQAKKLIGLLIKKNKELQKETPITSKQVWFLKNIAKESQASGLTDDMIHSFSKHDARIFIGKLKAQGQ